MTAHATLSASSAHRWLECPGSVKACEGLPNPSSEHAEEGSAAHALAETCLSNLEDTDSYLGQVIDGYDNFPVDDEMVSAVQQYLNFVRALDGELFVEERVSFARWVPDGFGTSDAILVNEDSITVVDLKYGKGIRVDAENNPQAMLYALGALAEFEFVSPNISSVTCVIVQPRLDHISEFTIGIPDLLAWAETVAEKAQLTQLDDAPFNPGEKQCQWCLAKAQCRPLAEFVADTVANDFPISTDVQLKSRDGITAEELARIIPHLGLIKKWCSVVEERAVTDLMRGLSIPGYKLVEGRSIRAWRDASLAEASLKKSKLKVGDIFTKKLITPTQAEKLLGKGHKLLVEHVTKPDGKPTLAPESDKRPALDFAEGFDKDDNTETDQ